VVSRVEGDHRGPGRDTLFDVNVLDLPPTTDSVPVARRFVRARLVDGDTDGAVDIDTAALLVSEVVTNAILHARTTVTLTVEVSDEVVRIAVRDGSPMRPRLHAFAPTSATGRGLRLLDALARRWGVDADPVTGGKIVWFEVGEPAESGWGDIPEPRRRETVRPGRGD
jgi:anti-sigma regulatory factor (Ser/Thr protein kinase)